MIQLRLPEKNFKILFSHLKIIYAEKVMQPAQHSKQNLGKISVVVGREPLVVMGDDSCLRGRGLFFSKKYGPNLASFCLFSSFSQFNYNYS